MESSISQPSCLTFSLKQWNMFFRHAAPWTTTGLILQLCTLTWQFLPFSWHFVRHVVDRQISKCFFTIFHILLLLNTFKTCLKSARRRIAGAVFCCNPLSLCSQETTHDGCLQSTLTENWTDCMKDLFQLFLQSSPKWPIYLRVGLDVNFTHSLTNSQSP